MKLSSRIRRSAVALASSAVLVAAGLVVVPSAAQATTIDGHQASVITMNAPNYTPKPINGGTDDYHCTLINPHVKSNQYIVASEFIPGHEASSVELHHAILFLVPPSIAAQAEAADAGGKGWTCFGETPLPNLGLGQLGETPWLSAWAPGHGKDVLPATTGTPLPAGSLVVMQIHYNLLRGDKPVAPSLKLWTVPASAKLRPTSLQLMPAPPDVPCATGVTGPLCNRTAALANLAKRFGASAPVFDAGLEMICGRNPVNPPVGNSTSCDWPIYGPELITRLGIHMHLTGASATITLDPGTPKQKVLLTVPAYNFDYQRSYDLAKWIEVGPGDNIQVSCTYNPSLRQELPQLRKLPPRFTVWGDGSSDEMCLGLVSSVPVNSATPTDWTGTSGGMHLGSMLRGLRNKPLASGSTSTTIQ